MWKDWWEEHGWISRQAERQVDGWMGRGYDKQLDIYLDGQMDRWVTGR